MKIHSPRFRAPRLAGALVLAVLATAHAASAAVPKALVELTGAVQLALGRNHACALNRNGGVRCWGDNVGRQIGDGTTAGTRLVATEPTGLSAGIAQVAAGEAHTCALTTTGGVKCWGNNQYGQLGTGDTMVRPVPTDVPGLETGVASISTGMRHTCAVMQSGAVKCWGINTWGSVGDGTQVSPRKSPTDVPALSSGVVALALGNDFSCARTEAGGVLCWGPNSLGQLGTGDTLTHLSPASVAGLMAGAAAIAAGDMNGCAVVGGLVRCWGQNSSGELGSAPGLNASPVVVDGLASGIAAVTVGSSFNCALTEGGAARCLGANWSGQLGDGGTTSRNAPQDVTGLGSGVAEVVAGYGHACARLVTGRVRCWGRNDRGQVGDNTSGTNRLVPVAVLAPPESLDPTDDEDGDGVPNGVELAEGLEPLVKDNDLFAANEKGARLFAMQQYRDFLGREGEAAGVADWAALVASGGRGRTRVIDDFLSSAEFAGLRAPVVRLYFATFLRVPDYAGLQYNAGLVRAGTLALRDLAQFFTASPEFAAAYGALDDTQYVTLLYENVLARAPDAPGLAGWVALLQGGMSRGDVLLGFSESPEFQAGTAHAVFVTMMYAGLLRRTPEAAGFADWLALLATGSLTRDQVIDGFFYSLEYRARFLP